MTEPKQERFVVFEPRPEPFFFMKDAEVRKVDFDDTPDPSRLRYQMQVQDAAGRRMILQVSPARLHKMQREAQRLERLRAAPWYRRWPMVAMRRLGYWSGRAIGFVLKKVHRK